MDPRLLQHYNRELQFLRDMGGEFAAEFPKIAGRLGMSDVECADPYVERLLEGFAFLAARVQLQLDAEFPRFTQQLLHMVYPQYLAPTPSMLVARLTPDPTSGELSKGFTLPRGTTLRGLLGKNEQTACEYRTAHDVTLWPLTLTEADYFARDLANMELPAVPGVRAGLRLRLKVSGGKRFAQLPIDRLPLFLAGGESAFAVYEQLFANLLAVIVRPVARPLPWQEVLPKASLRMPGYEDDQALLPVTRRGFQGYRLLQEYFAFPERFLFAELTGLQSALSRVQAAEVDIIFLLGRNDRRLEGAISASDFSLFCTPAINLFSRRADRVQLEPQVFEYHVVTDRTRPLDYEVYDVTEVVGYSAGNETAQEFLPLYALRETEHNLEGGAYYALRRAPRVLSQKQKRWGGRSSYVGGEAFLSLVDAHEAPLRQELKQLGLRVLCTNRDLPLHMPIGAGRTDLTLEASAPVETIHCIAGPTSPKPSLCHSPGELSWRLISHLTLNYLSLCDTDAHQGAAALREMLRLYGDLAEPHVRKQVEGLRSVTANPVIRRIPQQRRAAYGRGLETTVEFDETAFAGAGVFVLGAVLERFFAKYVSINSFTETVLRTQSRGEIMRWPARIGRRHLC